MKSLHPTLGSEPEGDRELVQGVRRGEVAAFRALMTRNNQRLFRAARGFVGTDHEAEDVVQEAYVDAFEKMHTFRGDSSLSTWLTRIVINEAKQRVRNMKDQVNVDTLGSRADEAQIIPFPLTDHEDPSFGAARSELRHFLEEAIGTLPVAFRSVFILREIEECTVDETAQTLGLRAETVKTRLHRARRLIRATLEARVAASLKDAFQFQGARCSRITERLVALMQRRGAIVDEPDL